MIATQITTSEVQNRTAYHVLPNISLRQRQKIISQLKRYSSIKHEALPQLAWKFQYKDTSMLISLSWEKSEGKESLRELIVTKKFDYSQPVVIKLFSVLCKAVQKLHRANIMHNNINAQNIFINAKSINISPPAFTLIEKVKKRTTKEEAIPHSSQAIYKSRDIVSLAFIFIEMLNKIPHNNQWRKSMSRITNPRLKTLIQEMTCVQAHRILTISDVLSSLSTVQLNEDSLQIRNDKMVSFQYLTLFELFRAQRNATKVGRQAQNRSQIIQKDSDLFTIVAYRIKDSSAILFQIISKIKKNIIGSYLYIHTHNSRQRATYVFDNVDALFSKIKEESTSVLLNSFGEVLIHFKIQPKVVEKDKKIQAIGPRPRAAAQKYQRELRQKQENVQFLLIVAQNEDTSSTKHQLRLVEQLIQLSRCLPETSKVIQPITIMWKRLLLQALKGESLEELLMVLGICQKYWLESDEIMNIMRKKITQLLQSGLWML